MEVAPDRGEALARGPFGEAGEDREGIDAIEAAFDRERSTQAVGDREHDRQTRLETETDGFVPLVDTRELRVGNVLAQETEHPTPATDVVQDPRACDRPAQQLWERYVEKYRPSWPPGDARHYLATSGVPARSTRHRAGLPAAFT